MRYGVRVAGHLSLQRVPNRYNNHLADLPRSDSAKVCAAFAWDSHDRQAPEQLSRGPLHGRFVCLAVVLSGVWCHAVTIYMYVARLILATFAGDPEGPR